MLTLEQIAEGRHLLAGGSRLNPNPTSVDDFYMHDLGHWLIEHAAELLAAAERVARAEAKDAADEAEIRAGRALNQGFT